jgi:hypothetical protein
MFSSAPNFRQRLDCVLDTPRSSNFTVASCDCFSGLPPASRSPAAFISASNCPARRSARSRMAVAHAIMSMSLAWRAYSCIATALVADVLDLVHNPAT